MNEFHDVGHQGSDLLAGLQRRVQSRLKVHGFFLVVLCQQEVLIVHYVGEARCEVLLVKQILDPKAAASDLVFVSRPDAAPRRADRRIAACLFPSVVELDVVRKYQLPGRADLQPFAHRDPSGLEIRDLIEQRGGR